MMRASKTVLLLMLLVLLMVPMLLLGTLHAPASFA